MPFLKSAPSFEQFVNDVKNLMLEAAARASAVFTSAKFQTDTFKDATGINSGTSTGYAHRGASNYDVIRDSGGVVKDSNTTAGGEIRSDAFTAAGQVFTASSAYTIGGCKFNLEKTGTPGGTMRAALYAVAAGVPTGAALATSPAVNCTTVPGGGWTETTFTFSAGYALSNGVQYVVVLEQVSAWGHTAGNNIRMQRNGTSVYAGGTQVQYAGSWSAVAGEDLYFKTFNAGYSSADIRSVTLTLPAVVTQVVMCADVTLNTGSAAYYVSTDGGTNWTTVALADLARVISVPSGLSLVARVVLTGDAELEFLSIAAAA